MLIEKSVNISTKHARALSGAKHQTSLAHAASLLLNNASQDLQLSVQLSLTFHRKRKRKTWRQWSETKLTQCNVTKQRGENLILFYVSVPVPTWSKKQKTIKPNGKECCLKGGGRRSVTENETKCTAGSHVDANTSRKTWKTTVGRPNTNSVTLFQANHE